MEETPPKTDFYIKLASEADMPSVLAPFYHQDTTTEAEALVAYTVDPTPLTPSRIWL